MNKSSFEEANVKNIVAVAIRHVIAFEYPGYFSKLRPNLVAFSVDYVHSKRNRIRRT